MLGNKTQKFLLLLLDGAFKFEDQKIIKDYSNFMKIIRRLKCARLLIGRSRRIRSEGDINFHVYYELSHNGKELAKAIRRFDDCFK